MSIHHKLEIENRSSHVHICQQTRRTINGRKMKWNIGCDEAGNYFLLVNDVRCVGESGKQNVVDSCSAGNSKDEIWFKLKGEKNGKRLRRGDVDRLNERLWTARNNTEFVSLLEEQGVNVNRRNRTNNSHIPHRPAPNEVEAIPAPEEKGIPEDLKILKEKSAGHFTVHLEQLIEPKPCYLLRNVDRTWVKQIKESMKAQPAAAVTRIPVLYEKEITVEEFKIDAIEEPLQTLGGNHMVAAMRDIMTEEGSNPYFECLRKIDVEIFLGLTQTEALFVSSWHNTRCQQKQLLFQDKVKIARKIGEKGEENWKEEVVVALGDLERKIYRKEGLGTVFSVASYSQENWEATERLFEALPQNSGSFPQNIFRQLQGVLDSNRTTYLTRALGTNGVKVAHQIVEDKRRDQLRKMAATILEEDSWEEVTYSYMLSDRMIQYSGDINTPEGRQRYANHVMELAKNDKDTWTVSIVIKKNGNEVPVKKEIVDKYSKKIIKEFKQTVSEE